MRHLTSWTVLIVALFVGTAARADTIGLDVTSNTQVFAPGVFHNIGWQFQVNAPITVSGLGIFDVNPSGLTENHQVGLWTDSGTLLAQTTVTNGSTPVASASAAGGWLFNSIAPIVLAPGTYLTGAFFADSADSVMANASITTVPEITFLHSRASTEGSFGPPGVYGLVEPGVFAADIMIAPTSVPEPGTLFLLGSGLAGMSLLRARKKRTA